MPADASVIPARARYRPIADYGAVGDGRSLALVCRDGSLDWWCPDRFDAPSVFAALLDAERGGRFRVGPVGEAGSVMRYVEDTNVLETTHTTATGRVRVRDMLVFPEDCGLSDALLLRRVAGVEGTVDMEAVLAPRFQYARVMPRFTSTPAGLVAAGGGELMLAQAPLSWVRSARGTRRAAFRVAAGERVDVFLRHAPFTAPAPFAAGLHASADDLEAATLARWRTWVDRTRFDGPDAALVRRSALALKLLQTKRNGSFVAAGTTSLPEEVGGIRNWDYRFVWVRDGVLTARALADVGHHEEAAEFRRWLHATVGADAGAMRIMYTLSGSADLPERTLPTLEGYRGSAPVRIGNGAVLQRQLDVYGELVDFLASMPDDDAGSWPLVESAAQWVVEHWREPDQGIWEMRCEPRHFVFSKAMAWVALDRSAALARRLGKPVPQAWVEEAAAIRESVDAHGYDEARGAFVQAYGHKRLDASNLLLCTIGFVDPRDPRMRSTVDRTMEELMTDGLVYRYHGDDGLPGGEAAFAYCAFWLVEALALQGRREEARALFDRLVARGSPVGLFAEEIEPGTGELLGNYPQAFPHAGLIAAAHALRNTEK